MCVYMYMYMFNQKYKHTERFCMLKDKKEEHQGEKSYWQYQAK